MKVLTCHEMRLVEASALEKGQDYLGLMENAGTAAARIIGTRYPLAGKSAVLLCGRGNNGGDGFVVARKLFEEGAHVTVLLLCGEPTSPESKEMLSRLRPLGVSILDQESGSSAISSTLYNADLVIDALYGIGFHGELPDSIRPLFRSIKERKLPVVAIDVPSGLNADTGLFDADTLPSSLTVTFTAMKPGLLANPFCGEIEVASIGIDKQLLAPYGTKQALIDIDMVKSCFHPRPLDSHKGTYGHLLALCGCYGMAGAAVLAIRAAQRTGVGLVTAALPRSIYPIVATQLPEAVFLPLPERTDEQPPLSSLDLLLAKAKACSALLIGCGLGSGEDVKALVEGLLSRTSSPIVLDADGINAVAGHIDIGKTRHAPLILTPHPGEMARLIGCSIDEVQRNRVEIAQAYARKNQAIVVLKGYRTVIAAPDQTVMINTTGNPGMATAGSGDVLAGMIASLVAQGMDPFHAAVCGVHLHGLAGDRAAARLSQHGLLPTDMIEELCALFLDLEK